MKSRFATLESVLRKRRMISEVKNMSGLVILLSVLIMLTQCTPAYREAPPLPGMEAEKMSDEVARLEETADKHTDPTVRVKAQLQLAKLYSSHKNPRPNYQRALKRLEMYLSFDPTQGETDEMQNWLALLRELVRERDELRKENRELKDTVEELKNLDIKMEEKRKQVK
jgi:hypothetical protein